MQIEVKLYTFSEAHLATHLFDTPELAFSFLKSANRNAHAYPAGTSTGLVNWQRQHSETITFEQFKSKLDTCK